VGICSIDTASDEFVDATLDEDTTMPQMPTPMMPPQMLWGYPPMGPSQMPWGYAPWPTQPPPSHGVVC
jgi:hypothetical protein